MEQIYGNAFWKGCSLWYIPALGSFYSNHITLRIGDVESFYSLVIACYRFFIYGISVFAHSVVTVFWKFCPAVCPVVICCHFFAAIQDSILIQVYGNAFRQLSSFRYVPGFGSFHLCGSGDGVDDVVTFYLRNITFDRFFFYGVGISCFSIFTVFRKFLPCIAPAIFCCHFFAAIQGSILFQDYCNAFRQFGSGWYVPALGSLYTGGSSNGIGNVISTDSLVITIRYICLIYCISIRFSFLIVFRQIVKTIFPVTISSYFSAAIQSSILIQVYGNAFRQFGSFRYVPGFGSLHTGSSIILIDYLQLALSIIISHRGCQFSGCFVLHYFYSYIMFCFVVSHSRSTVFCFFDNISVGAFFDISDLSKRCFFSILHCYSVVLRHWSIIFSGNGKFKVFVCCVISTIDFFAYFNLSGCRYPVIVDHKVV